MATSIDLKSLEPKRSHKVFDIVRDLQFDVTDWIRSASNPNKIKANPKYCYDWSFVEPNKIAIFSLWHGALRVEDDHIIFKDNFRKIAEEILKNGKNSQRAARASKLDRDAATAAREGLAIRVILVHGDEQDTRDGSRNIIHASKRELDAIEWHISKYNNETGDLVLVRGSGESVYADQFDSVINSLIPEKILSLNSRFPRERAVRQQALRRSQGKCEYCGENGFKMANGKLYLETHHIIPLGEGGIDHIINVIALCPTDHRKVHFGEKRAEMRLAMKALFTPHARRAPAPPC